MHPLKTYNVVPKLPAALEPLREIVFNLWWTWEPSARGLFRQIDPELWDRTNHSPLRTLQLCRQARLEELAMDRKFLSELQGVAERLSSYLEDPETYGSTRPGAKRGPVAYFSAEFGLHESIPNYSGGLGILSGDHCKSASDLGLNFCAVGLLYRHGYFKQQINREGWQEAVSLNQNFHHLPMTEVRVGEEPLVISVKILGQDVYAKIWKFQVGRIALHLLDTDLPQNSPENRLTTAELYGGDIEMRIKQEIVLGIGGVHALQAMGIEPSVYHMNEGHSAFLSLERVRRLVQTEGLDFYAAVQVVASSSVFTTHTPVPAGNDAFPEGLMMKYFGDMAGQMGVDFKTLMSFGQTRLNPSEPFSMTILALRMSRHANGVSALHGEVSQGLWKDVWQGVPQHEVPITSITNGIHTKTWTAPEFADLYTRHLGPDWQDHLTDPEYWRAVIDIPAEELWSTHVMLKLRLIEFIRMRQRRRFQRLGASPERLRRINNYLDPDVLTVGFARRFATYKRGNLLFKDLDRLARMVQHAERPVQFLFAGKAHPADEQGKALIQEVYKISQMPEFEGRVLFLEDYDAYMGRRLTQGVDLWLNNPLRPLEASGTSGMKLPPNGGLNLSILDGWWCEGYNGKNGWAIGPELTEGDAAFQNEVDVASLYSLLENQIVPLFYAKPDGKLPVAWIQLMRESIRSVTPVFSTHRMVTEYNERLYEPAAKFHAALSADAYKSATELSKWKTSIREQWGQINVRDVEISHEQPHRVLVGEEVGVTVKVHLGQVDPSNVRVQAYFGEIVENDIRSARIVDLNSAEKLSPGEYLYRGKLGAADSGNYGFNVRVVPVHPHLIQEHELRLITWAV